MKRRLTPSEAAEAARIAAAEAKYGATPESLKEKQVVRRAICGGCGRLTTTSPVPTTHRKVMVNGNEVDVALPENLCADCDPARSGAKAKYRNAMERRDEARRSARG